MMCADPNQLTVSEFIDLTKKIAAVILICALCGFGGLIAAVTWGMR